MKRFLALLLLATSFVVIPVMAAEESRVDKAQSAEVWKWLNFAILAGVLGYLIAKHLGPVLVSRSEQIQGGLAAGEKAKAEADARAAAVQAKLANLGQVVSQMKTDARDEREREAERIRRETQNELTRLQKQAAQDIESSGKLATLDLQRYAAKLAIDLAERKVRARMSPETQASLFNNFVGEIADGATKAQVS